VLNIAAIIPTLNARHGLAATIGSIREDVRQIVVSDGGSTDGTQSLAQDMGAELVAGAPGRGGQLRRGAQAASQPWLLFLHADTRLEPGWRDKAEAALSKAKDRAGYFRFALDDTAGPARRLERAVAWRSRVLGLPYGDQGLLAPRALYDALGGYRDMPLMEDVDLVRRIGRRNLVAIDADALTSATKFRRDGYTRRSARNLLCLALYFAGVSPATIKRIYG
jgi:rSAM/selenodomain-associated transferase 2